MVWPQRMIPPPEMGKRLMSIADKRLGLVETELRTMGSHLRINELLRAAYLQGLADGYDIAEKQK